MNILFEFTDNSMTSYEFKTNLKVPFRRLYLIQVKFKTICICMSYTYICIYENIEIP